MCKSAPKKHLFNCASSSTSNNYEWWTSSHLWSIHFLAKLSVVNNEIIPSTFSLQRSTYTGPQVLLHCLLYVNCEQSANVTHAFYAVCTTAVLVHFLISGDKERSLTLRKVLRFAWIFLRHLCTQPSQLSEPYQDCVFTDSQKVVCECFCGEILLWTLTEAFPSIVRTFVLQQLTTVS